MASGAPWYRQAVAVYDRSYRLRHGLDRPAARIGPVLCVQRGRLWRPLRLADGTVLRRGARIGLLHLNNARALALHRDGLDPGVIGFEFRRLVLASLRALATQAADGGPLAPLQAYAGTTLFHHRLPLLGFAPAPGDLSIGRHLVSRYERALLSSLHPAGLARLRRGARAEARRLWISRQTVLARFGMMPGEQPSPLHDQGEKRIETQERGVNCHPVIITHSGPTTAERSGAQDGVCRGSDRLP